MSEMITSELDWDSGEDAFPHERLSLTGDSRTEARLCVVQVVFWAESRGMDIRDVAAEFAKRLKVRKADKKLFDLLAQEAAEGAERYKAMIAANLLDNWTLERLDPVVVAILWTAFAELAANAQAPVGVVINEYLNIAKGFVAPEDVAFINKMLDTVGKRIRG